MFGKSGGGQILSVRSVSQKVIYRTELRDAINEEIETLRKNKIYLHEIKAEQNHLQKRNEEMVQEKAVEFKFNYNKKIKNV
jgi:hypothetical protein